MRAPASLLFMRFSFVKPSTLTKRKTGRQNAKYIHYISKTPRVVTFPYFNQAEGEEEANINVRLRERALFAQEPDQPVMPSVLQEVREHNGIVWRAILSLREDDAIKCGYTDRTSWEVALRATLPDLAHKMGIKRSDLKWVAAFHKEKGHPHVHLVFWDKSSQRKRGLLSKAELRFAHAALVREIYGRWRRRQMAMKSLSRDDIRLEALEETKNLFKVPRQERIALRNDLVLLSFELPAKGEIVLSFMHEAVMGEARRVADWVLSRPSFASSLARYEAIAEQLTKHHMTQHEPFKEAKQNATEDLRNRIAQVLLRAASSTRQSQRARGRTVRSALFLFPRIGLLLGRERRRLELEAAIECLRIPNEGVL